MVLGHLFIPYKGISSSCSSLTNKYYYKYFFLGIFLLNMSKNQKRTIVSVVAMEECNVSRGHRSQHADEMGSRCGLCPSLCEARGCTCTKRGARGANAMQRERLTGRRVVERRKGWWIWGDGGSLSRSPFLSLAVPGLSLLLSPNRSGSGPGVLRELQKKDTMCPHVQQLFLPSAPLNSRTY